MKHKIQIEQDLIAESIFAFSQVYPEGKFFLIASPAWGKTSCVISLFTSNKFKKIIYISPFISINSELSKKLELMKIPNIGNNDESYKNILKENKKGFLILTPEKIIRSGLINEMSSWSELIVVDEFHLFMLWENFRPDLIECWHWLSTVEKSLLLLSGTFNWNEWAIKPESKNWLSNSPMTFCVDLHQGRCIYEPHFLIIVPKYFIFLVHITIKMFLVFSSYKMLVFLPKRYLVERWQKWSRRRLLNTISCVGGEGNTFLDRIEKNPNINSIFSTSVLSHGVNLPPIDMIFILGDLWEKEIWLQMKSRAGRNGEKFILISEKQKWM